MGVSDREDDDVRRGRDDGEERRRRKKDGDDDDDEDAVRKERDDRKRDGGGRSRSRKSSTGDRRKRRDDDNNKRKRKKEREEQSDDDDDDDSKDEKRNDKDRKRNKKKSSRSSRSRRHRRDKKRTSKGRKKKPRRKYSSSSSSSSSSDDDSSSSSSSSSSDSSDGRNKSSSKKKKVINERLLAKLNARGETLEERNERRSQKRAANIQARFGYTAEENPFNDPNLHETFTWNKRKDAESAAAAKNVKGGGEDNKKKSDTLSEIETIRRRRKERDEERDEMDRIRAEELKMKEYENYDEWAKKEEEFHLEQQRKRSAIRLVEGREKPIDVLAKNLLLFGLSDQEKKTRAAVKYQERYNVLDQLDKLDAELEEPYKLIRVLKLSELKELLTDIDAFRMLEKQTAASINNLEEGGGNENESSRSSIVLYWDALHLVTQNEIMILEKGGDNGPFAKKIEDIKGIFQGQSRSALDKMKSEVDAKIRKSYHGGGDIDRTYWASVQDQLMVYLAMMDLKELHSKMLVRQLERLEQRKQEQLQRAKDGSSSANDDQKKEAEAEAAASSMVPKNVSPDFGNDEEEIGENDEVDVANGDSSKVTKYPWQDKYKPRKPRYFNRVKTGYDWNKYNQTHYDHENPPPKTVQGYKFNIFYPDLVDPTKTPSYHMEPADNDDFCILRFHAGAPYEDVAFKIINREWNRSRKRGFRCTFERGVLSLYFNFTTHWYRR